MSTVAAAPREDWRVRVGRERREKMRQRLLAAVLRCFAVRKQHETPSIEDVIEEAGVSRPTFYLHFLSMEEAVNALGRDIADQTLHDMEAFLRLAATPLHRLATGIQLFLLRGVTDPMWAAFGARTNFLQDPAIVEVQKSDLLMAREAGLVQFRDVIAAVNLMNGAMRESMLHLVRTDERHRSYVEESTVMILCGVRADYETAMEAVHDRAIYIRGLAPDRLAWWRDPWI